MLVASQTIDAIDDDTVLTATTGLRLRAASATASDSVVLLGDRRLEMPGWLEPAMRMLASSDHARPSDDLEPAIADPTSRLVLARRLVREGLLLADPVRARRLRTGRGRDRSVVPLLARERGGRRAAHGTASTITNWLLVEHPGPVG